MKRPGMDSRGSVAISARASDHVVCSSAREGKEQDAFRINAAVNQRGNAPAEDCGFSGTRAGNDEVATVPS